MASDTDRDSVTRDDCGGYVYCDGRRWALEDSEAMFMARDWHGGQHTDMYAFQCGDTRPSTIAGALNELSGSSLMVAHSDDETRDSYDELMDALYRWYTFVRDLLCEDADPMDTAIAAVVGSEG